MKAMRFRLLPALLLLAPALALAQRRPAIYVVQSGDTPYRIASTHGLTVEALRQLNDLDGDTIAVGQRLRLTNAIPLPDTRPGLPPVETPGGGAPPTSPPARSDTPPAQPAAIP